VSAEIRQHHIEFEAAAITMERDYFVSNERGRSAAQNDNKRQTGDSNTAKFMDAVAFKFKNSFKIFKLTPNMTNNEKC
jgi:hypothetical protein